MRPACQRVWRRMHRIVCWGVMLICLLLAHTCVAAPQSTTTVSDQQIQASIRKAVNYLRQVLHLQNTGRLSLAVLALLKAEVSPESPELKGVLNQIAARVNTDGRFDVSGDHNYDAAVTLMALANADPKKYRRQIEVLTNYLIERQTAEGGWDYPPGHGASQGTGDTSITQYAILALWEAARAEIDVPKRVWDKAAAWHIARQQRDGGFAYHPLPGGSQSSHTMTVAGTASLLVTRLHLFGAVGDQSDVVEPSSRKKRGKKFGLLTPSLSDEEDETADPGKDIAVADGPPTVKLTSLDRAVGGGRKWLTDRFVIEPQTPWTLYYLYGVERWTALANLREIAGHDWYTEGAASLVSKQGPAGNWNDSSGDAGGTSFAVMFLVQATAKALNRPRTRDPRFGGGLLVGGRGLPENLQNIQLDKGGVKVRKLKGPIDELLAELENAQSQKIESAQSALVDTLVTENPEALIGQTERLLRLSRDRRPEVRRTAYWGLGRSNEVRVAPVLIAGLSDADLSCMIEARNALRYLSKRINYIELPDEPTDAQRAQAIAQWKKWYQTIRAYDERDDLSETAKP